MARSGVGMVVLALCAGALAGLAVQLLARDDGLTRTDSPAVETVDHEEFAEVLAEVGRLNARIGELELLIESANAERAQLERKVAETVAKTVAAAAERSSPANQFAEAISRGVSNRTVTSLPATARIQLGQSSSPHVVQLSGFGAGSKLTGLTEDERWEKMREDLSLDSYQLDELKRIRDDYRRTVKEAFASSTDGNRRFDFKTLSKAGKDANERAKNLLSETQYEKYNSGWYRGTLGLGGGTSFSTVTVVADETEPSEGK